MRFIKIALDLDDVLLPLRAIVCRKIGIDPENQIDFDWGIYKKEFWDIYHDLLKSGEYWNAPLLDIEAPWIVQNIKDMGHEIDIVSGKPQDQVGNVKAWLVRNNFTGINNVVCVEKIEDKVALNYDRYIDDSPKLIKPIIESRTKKQLFLINKPYSRGIYIPKNAPILRVDNLRDVERILYFMGN